MIIEDGPEDDSEDESEDELPSLTNLFKRRHSLDHKRSSLQADTIAGGASDSAVVVLAKDVDGALDYIFESSSLGESDHGSCRRDSCSY